MMFDKVEENLSFILEEMETQKELSKYFPENMLSFDETFQRIHEYIDEAGEYSLAYELIVILLESYGFTLSGAGAVKLLELGLIMKFKTTRDSDKEYALVNDE